MTATKQVTSGLGVDSRGGPVVDPTANVIALNDAANKRQDDLREAERRYNDLRYEHVAAVLTLHAQHHKELAIAEAARINSIRQIDREEVAKTAGSANIALSTLAASQAAQAETLRNQVATTAQAAEGRRALDMAEVNKRLSALELGASSATGRQTVADPQLAELMAEVRQSRRARDASTGKSAGISAVGAVVLGAFAIIGSLIGIVGFIMAIVK